MISEEDSKDFIKLEYYDGFGRVNGDLFWNANNKANIYYLHGALHLFMVDSKIKKQRWKQGETLIQQIKTSITNGEFPLFVTKGESDRKLDTIRKNGYLDHSYKNLRSSTQEKKDCFFIFGHSLSKNDDHILKRLAEGKFPKLYISIFEDPNSKDNQEIQEIIKRAEELKDQRLSEYPLELEFYDAATADVWGKPIFGPVKDGI